jgi:hypothetical protein
MASILGRLMASAVALAPASTVLASSPDTPPVAPPVTASTPAPSAPALPAGTVIELALTQQVGSKISKRGDRFGIRLTEDLKLDDATLLPAGTEGEGEVVHAAPGKMGGGPGELLLAARFLDRDGVRVPLKAFKVGRSGKNNVDNAVLVGMVVGPFALFVQGGEVVIPAGTIANAKLAADLPAPPAPVPSTPAAPTPAPSPPPSAPVSAAISNP